MFAGPIIAREVFTAPRPLRYYLWRASFASSFSSCCGPRGSRSSAGRTCVRSAYWRGLAASSTSMFAMLQLTLMLFFAPLFTAAAVSYEKDRRTFTLLLMTDLSDLEIVLGKLVAGLLNIFAILAASVGLLSLCAFFGGISFGQVMNLFAVTAASGVAGGAPWALDRSLARPNLSIDRADHPDGRLLGSRRRGVCGLRPPLVFMDVPLVEVLNPYRAMLAVLYPQTEQATGVVRASSLVYIGARLTFAAALVAFGTWKLRTWNPGRNEPRELREDGEVEAVESLIEVDEEPALAGASVGSDALIAAGRSASGSERLEPVSSVSPAPTTSRRRAPGEPGPTTGLHVPRRTHRRIARQAKPYRQPWANPILWRELMTRAYGAKPLIIKGCYVLLFALGMGLFFYLCRGSGKPALVDLGTDPDRAGDPQPDPDQCPGRVPR